MDITRIERRLFLSDINSEMLEKRITQTVIVAKRQYGDEFG